jgi:hypothetical protein
LSSSHGIRPKDTHIYKERESRNYIHGCNRASNVARRVRQTGLRNGGLRLGDRDRGAGLLAVTDGRWLGSPRLVHLLVIQLTSKRGSKIEESKTEILCDLEEAGAGHS